MWVAVIRRKGITEPLQIKSPKEIEPIFLTPLNWLLFKGEFDTLGLPWTEVEDFHIYQEGELVA